MSLASSASPWINDGPSQKRQPTMNKNKTMKRPPPPLSTNTSSQDWDTTGDFLVPSQLSSSSTDTQFSKELGDVPTEDARQKRISELVQQMHERKVDDDGQHLADFKPLSHPAIQTKKHEERIPGDAPIQLPSVFPSAARSSETKETGSPFRFAPVNGEIDGKNSYYSVYQPPPTITQSPYYAGKAAGAGAKGTIAGNGDQRWNDKMNYIIHLLEEQANEKTNTNVEEFVMFTMVGVFIIYVLDSFSRYGRYVR